MRLSDAREDHGRRIAASEHDPLQLTLRHYVETAAEVRWNNCRTDRLALAFTA